MQSGGVVGRVDPLGEVAERPMAHAWKACNPERGSWVRIPPSPLKFGAVSRNGLAPVSKAG
jgi:hypothetical protein